MQVREDEDNLVLDGIPVIIGASKRKSPDAPSAPPPMDVTDKDSESAEPSSAVDDLVALILTLEYHSIQGEDMLRE